MESAAQHTPEFVGQVRRAYIRVGPCDGRGLLERDDAPCGAREPRSLLESRPAAPAGEATSADARSCRAARAQPVEPAGAPPALGEGADDGCVCPVCLEPLWRAMIPACGHALCGECVGRVTTPAPSECGCPAGQPTCPVCRAPVDSSSYRRCAALDKATARLYPAAAQARAAAADAGALPAPAARSPENTLAGLRVWEAARREELLAAAVERLWDAIRANQSSSTALLLAEDLPPAESAELCPRGTLRVYPSGLRIASAPSDDSPAALAWMSFWGLVPEVAARLRAQGLGVQLFRSRGVRHVLVTWAAESEAP